jgi:hypothetical protein
MRGHSAVCLWAIYGHPPAAVATTATTSRRVRIRYAGSAVRYLVRCACWLNRSLDIVNLC